MNLTFFHRKQITDLLNKMLYNSPNLWTREAIVAFKNSLLKSHPKTLLTKLLFVIIWPTPKTSKRPK